MALRTHGVKTFCRKPYAAGFPTKRYVFTYACRVIMCMQDTLKPLIV